MRISDWSSDVCSSDLPGRQDRRGAGQQIGGAAPAEQAAHAAAAATTADAEAATLAPLQQDDADEGERQENVDDQENCRHDRSEERRVGKEGVSTSRSRRSTYH